MDKLTTNIDCFDRLLSDHKASFFLNTDKVSSYVLLLVPLNLENSEQIIKNWTWSVWRKREYIYVRASLRTEIFLTCPNGASKNLRGIFLWRKSSCLPQAAAGTA